MSLPYQYAQLEYIENPSTAYIDVGFAPNQNTRVDCEFAVTGYVADSNYLLGPWESGKRFFYVPKNPNEATAAFGYGAYYETTTPVPTINTKYTVSLNKNVSKLYDANGSQVGSTITFTANNFQATTNLAIFSIYPTSSSSPTKAKVYLYKVWNNDTLIRDMIPAYHYATTTYGLYDLLNDVFYPAAGSVPLTGPTLPTQNINYLQQYRRTRNLGPINGVSQ